MTQTTADHFPPPPPAPRPVKRGRPPTDRQRLEGESRTFAPTMPTSGADLVAQWELPAVAWKAGRVKLTRKLYASQAMELVAECSVEDYDLMGIARDFGPGDYYLMLSAPPDRLWKPHNCKVSVSPEYARTAGFNVYTPPAPPAQPTPPLAPRLADVAAMSQAAAALNADAPITMGNLMLIIEGVVERTVRATAQTAAPVNPLSLDGMMGFWSAMQKMQDQTRQQTMEMFALAQGRESAGDVSASSGWSEILAEALPGLLAAFRPAAPPAAPLPAQVQPPPALTYAEPQETPAVQVKVPLTSNEAAQFAAAVAMLKPFVPQLLAMMEASEDDQAIAADLAQFIPFPLKGQLLRLAELTEARGPDVLGVIAADLQTPRAAAVVAALRAHLSA